MGARVVGNRVTGCRYGIQVGASYWDFVATYMPAGVEINGNLVHMCSTPYAVNPLVIGNVSLGVRFASVTYDPPSLADGAGVTQSMTVTGAEIGGFVEISFSQNLSGITLTAWVSAANTVSVRFQNESGGVLDIPSGVIYARVSQFK